MSVSWGTQYSKLKTNLRLASNRLKLLQKKKTEQAVKARYEIAEFLSSDKEDRARIRVESIIREDFVVEAYELLEMYCELLLARFGIIQQMKELDDGIAEAVSSLLWVAPRIGHEIAEFKVINDELTHKYGKQFAEAARMNQLPEPSRVSPKLIHKLSVSAPSKLLIEKYLITIAQSAGIDFTPDPKVMRDDDDEVARAERNLINFMNEEQIGWRGGGGGNGGGGGGSFLSDVAGGGDSTLASKAPVVNAAPYQPANKMAPPPEYAPPPPPQYPAATYPNPSATAPYPAPHPYPSANFAHQHPSPQTLPTDHHIYEVPPPNAGKTITPPPAMQHHDDNDYLLPKFPEPPQHVPAKTTSANDGGGGGEPDLDFDALARRFEELKKKL